jgi:hypothetical protein
MVDDGWLVVHIVASQLFGRPSEAVARIAQRLSSRGARLRSVTRFRRTSREPGKSCHLRCWKGDYRYRVGSTGTPRESANASGGSSPMASA